MTDTEVKQPVYKILLFSGYNTPEKRYRNISKALAKKGLNMLYIPHHGDISENIEVSSSPVILAHSIGVLSAILYCYDKNINPLRIISMDGSFLYKEVLEKDLIKHDRDPQFLQGDSPVKNIKETYLGLPDKVSYKIDLFRYIQNIGDFPDYEMLYTEERNMRKMTDATEYPYNSVRFYTESCGHYPFESAKILTEIISLIEKSM